MADWHVETWLRGTLKDVSSFPDKKRAERARVLAIESDKEWRRMSRLAADYPYEYKVVPCETPDCSVCEERPERDRLAWIHSQMQKEEV